MNCHRCHHMDKAHAESKDIDSMMKLGACQIPECTCKRYQDGIKTIDEDLL